jgi:hypothetical protein
MLAFVRNLMGRTIAIIGFGLMSLIPVWFLLQLLGVVQSGVEQFGVLGYGLILASILFPGFGLLLLGMKIAGDR